ncbi:MAG: tRNA (adenosine(37)-N6)-threonylcarbamoyltransferase complex dimerization subunit type 1 TsaB [Chloroflexi bacterium GWB2_49_20]|nr:MAG: tRNA (adenosine(37)-N6)-threonylcarbamoyltransferase complex dimerization subunit type 1 TsaB [Chloroflexi bacterium GWB2_49_20]OGN80307.1 MAG: tRNA (adenosine(37)-N6)-threonylcarbamoyltransferase complex dimerization subunit type 1 TsaB [Chloroflexi bacterium GWC2_49_37]OGN86053.1 MAG: tRNA (adenosine(37)-N6)-threonylcarbamoyltransferase complex dimerization subunit type 1 TsaB [Chloroflexi bacterium GWD2_49_16]
MLLALDTSTAHSGLALYDGVQILGELSWHSHLRQTVELAPAISELMKRVNTDMGAVRAIGIAIGPGSFTSLRVGLSLAKGLSLARHIPLIGIPSLNILAAALPVQNIPLAATLQAGRGRLAVGWYHTTAEGWQADGPVVTQTADELADSITTPTLVCGELNEDQRQRLARKYKNVSIPSPAHCVRRPGILAELAWQRWQAGDTDSAASLAPIYLHVAGGPPA